LNTCINPIQTFEGITILTQIDNAFHGLGDWIRSWTSPCFPCREEIVLIQREVEKKNTTINSKHSNIITNEQKKKVWTEIAEKTSSLGIAIRTPNEIKEKWNNLKKKVKKSIRLQTIQKYKMKMI
jgi:hypothetical protein